MIILRERDTWPVVKNGSQNRTANNEEGRDLLRSSVVVVVVIDTVGPVITIVITPKNKLAAVKTITKKKIFCVVAVRA